jgi:hypothetical protein
VVDGADLSPTRGLSLTRALRGMQLVAFQLKPRGCERRFDDLNRLRSYAEVSMAVGAGVATDPLIKPRYYRSRTPFVQASVALEARISGVVLDVVTFCVKKWYNSTFTIHQFDNE